MRKQVVIKEISMYQLNKMISEGNRYGSWKESYSILPRRCCISRKWVWLSKMYFTTVWCSVSPDDNGMSLGDVLISSESYVLYRMLSHEDDLCKL